MSNSSKTLPKTKAYQTMLRFRAEFFRAKAAAEPRSSALPHRPAEQLECACVGDDGDRNSFFRSCCQRAASIHQVLY